jgi:hypothetical protein
MSAAAYGVDLGELASLQEVFRAAPEIASEELVAAIWNASLLLERETKERTPTGATSTLRSSIAAYRPTAIGMTVVGEMGTPVAHAVPVELGTKPHRPPIEPLIDWAEARLGLRGKEAKSAAWAIANKIAAHGTDGAFMFKTAFEANEAQVQAIVTQALGRILERMVEAAR